MVFVDNETVFSTMSEFDANTHYKQRAIDFAVSHPRRTVELAFLKAGRYLSPSLNAAGFSGGVFSVFCVVWYFALTVLILAGGLDLHHKLACVGLLAGPFLQFLLVHMVFVGSIRYRLPVEFPLSILAAHGLVALRHRWNERARRDGELRSGVT